MKKKQVYNQMQSQYTERNNWKTLSWNLQSKYNKSRVDRYVQVITVIILTRADFLLHYLNVLEKKADFFKRAV